jgi:hypothetical protein
MSNFQFTLYDQAISEKEANSLLAMSATEPIKIELTKLVKISKLNTKQLFELAVSKKDENLAQLAWKLSVNPQAQTAKRYAARKNTVPNKIAPEDLTTDSVISTLCRSKALWTAGTAALLWGMYQADVPAEQELTLRRVSEMFVNKVWFDDLVPENSVVFKGFSYIAAIDKAWEADVTKTKTRTNYHAGPMYTGLRAGLLWAKHHGLVETREAISYGKLSGPTDSVVDKMQRKYYTIHPTLFGIDTMKIWDDCLELAVNYFVTYTG